MKIKENKELYTGTKLEEYRSITQQNQILLLKPNNLRKWLMSFSMAEISRLWKNNWYYFHPM